MCCFIEHIDVTVEIYSQRQKTRSYRRLQPHRVEPRCDLQPVPMGVAHSLIQGVQEKQLEKRLMWNKAKGHGYKVEVEEIGK